MNLIKSVLLNSFVDVALKLVIDAVLSLTNPNNVVDVAFILFFDVVFPFVRLNSVAGVNGGRWADGEGE